MIKSILTVAVAILITCLGTLSASDLTEDLKNVRSWNEIPDKSLSSYIDEINNNRKWPKLESVFFCNTHLDPQLVIEKQKFIDEFYLALQEYFLRAPKAKLLPFNEEFSGLLRLRDVSSESGGYRGILFGVVLHELATFRLAQEVLENPKMLDEERWPELLDSIKLKKVDAIELFERVQPECQQFSDAKEILKEVFSDKEVVASSKKNFYQFLELLQKKLPEKIAPNTTSIMIEKRGVLKLMGNADIYRMLDKKIGSGILSNATLPCLVHYCKKGGEISRLQPYDTTEYMKVLGDSKWKYSYPILAIRTVGTTRLYSLIDSLKDDRKKREYLERLLK